MPGVSQEERIHMKSLYIYAALALACAGTVACSSYSTPANLATNSTATAVTIALVGDSTMAPNSGYGDAFCARWKNLNCLNRAKGGRSSGSYRAEGLWQNLLQELADKPGKRLVLIQFGHNDQPGKPGRSTDLKTEFPTNLARYVDELRALGAEPVLLTPLTRRSFKDGQLQNDLRAWAEAAIEVAANKQVALLDLNKLSYELVQAMGQQQADTLAMAAPPAQTISSDTRATEPQGAAKSAFDRTHLGKKGADLFASVVQNELLKLKPELAPWVQAP